jgi:hypothetical protein
MNEEIEAIKGHLDVLIARSLAQEALLLHLARKTEVEEFWGPSLDLGKTLAHLRHEASYSGLTDGQLALVGQEMQRLHHRLSTLPPASELPF